MIRNAQPKPERMSAKVRRALKKGTIDEETRARQSAAGKAAWAAGKHDCLRKLVDRPAACKQCGGPFIRKSRNRILGSRFCSCACQREHLRTRAEVRQKERTKACPHCGVVFCPQWTGRSFQSTCSRRCYDALRLQRRSRPILFTDVPCVHCGTTVRRRAAEVRRNTWTVCSVACRQAHNQGANHHQWRGDEPGWISRGPVWQRLAESIRMRDGYACVRCGIRHDGVGRRFPVDHIRPWRSFEKKDEANDPSNLVTLCHSCHCSKTSGAERLLLKGDTLAFKQYLQQIGRR